MSQEPLTPSGSGVCPAPGGPATCAGYFRKRWRGELPLARVFWNDMLLVGTIVNATTTLLAVLLVTAGVAKALALATFFAPLPFNVFLVVSVWRSADAATGIAALAAKTVAVLWLLTATIL